jgi:LmbE family N-acetylglucosaminyl deacetylase
MVAVAPADQRQIRGEGETSEREWRDWLERLAPQSLPASMQPGAGERLVVVSPHPDDEVLTCGGMVAAHAARGGDVAVVAVTDGEASHRDDPRWPAARLAEARRAERTRGLARLGVGASAVVSVGLADGAVDAGRAALREALHGVLRADDVVVTTWSLDGHPDHDAAGAAVDQVCAERGCRVLQAPVWMWHWSTPFDGRVPWQRLRAWAIPPHALGLKASALAEHATQLAPRADALGPVLGPAILARAARTSEYFFV